MIGFNWFHKIFFGALALILFFIVADDVQAVLSWERVDAQVTSVTETCLVGETAYSTCAEANRKAFHDGGKLTRSLEYDVVWRDKNGQIQERHMEGRAAKKTFGDSEFQELVSLRVSPDPSKPPIQTRNASYYMLTVGIIALILWFGFLPIDRNSIWGMVSFSDLGEVRPQLGLAQVSWRAAFFCLWVACLLFSGSNYSAQIRQDYFQVNAEIEALEKQCKVTWHEWVFLKRIKKQTSRMGCAEAEQQRLQMNRKNARVEADDRYLVSYVHPKAGERAVRKWTYDFPNAEPALGSNIVLFTHPYRVEDTITVAKLEKRGSGYLLFYIFLGATIILGAAAIWLFNSSAGRPAYRTA